MIVALDSGVADVLKRYYLPPGTSADFLVDTRAAEDVAAESLEKALAGFVRTPMHGKLLGQSLHEALVKHCSWEAAARSFIAAIFDVQPVATSAGASGSRNEVVGLLRKESVYVDNECRRICGKSIGDIFVSRSFERWQSQEAYDSSSLQTATTGTGHPQKIPSWDDVVQSGPAVVLLGDPGTGKTLCMLRHVQQRCLSALSGLEEASTDSDQVLLAAYFHASELAARLIRSGESTLDVVLDLLLIRHGPLSPSARNWMHYALHAGRVLLVVDALDEVGMPPDEGQLGDAGALVLERLLAVASGATPCSVILSSRAQWYGASVSLRADEWWLRSFTPSQLKSAVRKWMSGHPETVNAITRAVAVTPPLADLLRNPMLLMLACRVWQAEIEQGKALAVVLRRTNRTQLYSQFANHLRARWVERAIQKRQPLTLFQQETFLPLVENVAWNLFVKALGRSSFRGSEVVDAIDNITNCSLTGRSDLFENMCDAGILTKVAAHTTESPYLFSHQTLLEFFAARHLAHRVGLPAGRRELVEGTHAYFGDPRAYVMLWMLAGNLTDASGLVRAILEWDGQTSAMAAGNHPSPVLSSLSLVPELLVDCLFESHEGTLDRDTRDQCWAVITRGIDERHRSRRRRGERWAAIADWSLLFRALRAVQIHDGMLSRADDVLNVLEHAHQEHASGLIAVSPTDAEIESALQRGVTSTCSVVRWTALWLAIGLVSAGRHEYCQAFQGPLAEALQRDPNNDVRALAARALPELSSVDALPLLKGAIEADNFRVAAAAAFGLGKLATDEALEVLHDAVTSLFTAPSGRDRDALLAGVVGALEMVVDKALHSRKEETSLQLLLRDERLAGVFRRALAVPAPVVQGTAASGLGKMGWAAAWDELTELFESTGQPSPEIQRLRASTLFACDRLARVLEVQRLSEAERLFRATLTDRRELLSVRRPAMSGIVNVVRRGQHSAGLSNELLEAALDSDAMIARSAEMALIQLDPTDVLEDMILLIKTFPPARRQSVCAAVADWPSVTGVRLILWLLQHDEHPEVLASSVFAISTAYEKASERKYMRPVKELQEVAFVVRLVEQLLELSGHSAARVVASTLGVFGQLMKLPLLRTTNQLHSLKEQMLARTRILLTHEAPSVQASLCTVLAFGGTANDLEVLASLRVASRPTKVQRSAKWAHAILPRRLGDQPH